jgi:hypothetical protein
MVDIPTCPVVEMNRTSSMVDDEVYREPRRKQRAAPGVRESRTSPANSVPEGLLYGGGSNVSDRSPRDNQRSKAGAVDIE